MVAKYLRAAHFLPTLLVTTLAFLFSRTLFNLNDSLLIGVTVFSGQLIVGWTNDLVDAQSDRMQERKNKPVATGQLRESHLCIAIYIDMVICILLSLLGTLGLRGGLLHLLAVGSGVSYNFYFKKSYFSPLPYIFAFAALPSMPYVALSRTPPLWLVTCGGLFGIIAHFTNVLKDLDEDRIIGIRGLPQRLGTRGSILIASVCLVIISIIISNQRNNLIPWFSFSLPLAMALIIYKPKKFGFPSIMLLALIDVYLLF